MEGDQPNAFATGRNPEKPFQTDYYLIFTSYCGTDWDDPDYDPRRDSGSVGPDGNIANPQICC